MEKVKFSIVTEAVSRLFLKKCKYFQFIWKARANRSPDLHPGSSCGRSSSSSWAVPCCFPQAISRKLEQKWSSHHWNQWRVGKHCRQWLYLLLHKAGPKVEDVESGFFNSKTLVHSFCCHSQSFSFRGFFCLFCFVLFLMCLIKTVIYHDGWKMCFEN